MISLRNLAFLAVSIGALAGLASGVFLIMLDWVTNLRTDNSWLIYLLPLGACLNSWVYQHQFVVSNQAIQKGTMAIVEASRGQKMVPSWLMAPMILVTTLATHLFGGSAGREGTAIQMAGGLMAGLQKYIPNLKIESSRAMKMAIAAGFSAVFGVPWAGIIFAFEVSKTRQINFSEILAVVLASWVAFGVCGFMPITHTHYDFQMAAHEPMVFFWVVLAAIVFGLAAKSYVFCAEIFTLFFKKISNPHLRVAVGGILVLLIWFFLQIDDYQGIGIKFIEKSFVERAVYYSFLVKILLTSITLTSGMKGGEVTPLFFVGAALGSFLAGVIPLPIGFLAGLGFIAVFAGASKTPFACAVMGLEIFDPKAGLFFLIACLIANFVAGKKGIYGE